MREIKLREELRRDTLACLVLPFRRLWKWTALRQAKFKAEMLWTWYENMQTVKSVKALGRWTSKAYEAYIRS